MLLLHFISMEKGSEGDWLGLISLDHTVPSARHRWARLRQKHPWCLNHPGGRRRDAEDALPEEALAPGLTRRTRSPAEVGGSLLLPKSGLLPYGCLEMKSDPTGSLSYQGGPKWVLPGTAYKPRIATASVYIHQRQERHLDKS